MAETYEISTLEDVARVYAKLPAHRAELLIKEMGNAVRMIAPVLAASDALGFEANFLPIRWINDTKGKATMNVRTDDGALDASIKVVLPQ